MEGSPDHLHQELVSIVTRATNHLRDCLCGVCAQIIKTLVAELKGSRRLACYGVGREGLAMKGLAMRLFHLGLQATVVGETTAVPLGAGDVLLVSAGPGYFSTVAALAREARKAGAHVIAFTSVAPRQLQLPADLVIQLPASCLPPAEPCDGEGGVPSLLVPSNTGRAAGGQHGGEAPVLPMGSSYELALQLFSDMVCMLLQQALAVPEEEMRQRHTNME